MSLPLKDMWHILKGKPKTCETFSFFFFARVEQVFNIAVYEALRAYGRGVKVLIIREGFFLQFCLLPVWQEVVEKRLLSLGRTLGEASLDMQ